jgi:hypothetical protein
MRFLAFHSYQTDLEEAAKPIVVGGDPEVDGDPSL